jgi:4-amino-4-deoxy-L-arabinose transferase-like glycosyltransferase
VGDLDLMNRGGFAPTLAILALALVLKGIVWAVTLPPFDGPDEAAHFAYAQTFALGHVFPTSGELHDRPDIQALVNAVLVRVVPPDVPAARFWPERASSGTTTGREEASVNSTPAGTDRRTPAGEYGPVSYALSAAGVAAGAKNGIIAQLMGARVVSVVVGALAALSVVWAALEAGLDRRLAAGAGAVAGFQPMWSQQTAIVTSDAALILASTAFLALTLRWLRTRRPSVALLAALCLGIGLLTKPSMIAATPLLGIFALPAFGSGQHLGERLRTVAIFLALAAIGLVPFWLWTINHPGVTLTGQHKAAISAYVSAVLAHQAHYYTSLIESFWGTFGWFETSLPRVLIVILRWLTVGTLLVAAGVNLTRGSPAIRRSTLLAISFVVATAAELVIFDIQYWISHGFLSLQGRYLLPLLPAFALIWLGAVQTIASRARLGSVAVVAVGAMIALNVVSLEVLWSRNYVA